MTLSLLRRAASGRPSDGRTDGPQTMQFGPTIVIERFEPTREQAIVQLWSDFPDVAERIITRVYVAYESALGTASGAMEATRARIADACAA